MVYTLRHAKLAFNHNVLSIIMKYGDIDTDAA